MFSLRQKIGQMLLMGFSGDEINLQSPVVNWLKEDGLGGVLLFDFDFTTASYGKNLKDQQQIKMLTRKLSHVARENNKLPLFIAIDYEGGSVDRLSKVPGCMKTLKASVQATLTNEGLYVEAEQMALTLKELGFNLNFAPVVDLNLTETSGIIGSLGRSFSTDPKEVIRCARQIVKAFSHHGLITAYKHFPGHGSATGDTHEGFVDVTEHFRDDELLPYYTLLKDHQAPVMVMTAHVINRTLDDSGLPATLSYPILTDLLRKKIGFDGVIISDDLQMHAISRHYELEDSLRLTIKAGADMIIFGNQLGHHEPLDVINCIERLVLSGAIPEHRIEASFERILKLKQAILHKEHTVGCC